MCIKTVVSFGYNGRWAFDTMDDALAFVKAAKSGISVDTQILDTETVVVPEQRKFTISEYEFIPADKYHEMKLEAI